MPDRHAPFDRVALLDLLDGLVLAVCAGVVYGVAAWRERKL